MRIAGTVTRRRTMTKRDGAIPMGPRLGVAMPRRPVATPVLRVSADPAQSRARESMTKPNRPEGSTLSSASQARTADHDSREHAG